jgi:Tol biopolymer transport system component
MQPTLLSIKKTFVTMALLFSALPLELVAQTRQQPVIAFASNRTGRHQIWMVNASGGAAVQVTTAGSGNQSSRMPDLRKAGTVAFEFGASGVRGIHLVEPDGSNDRRLTTSRSDEINPAWSPDGRYIAYSSLEGADYDIRIHYVGNSTTASDDLDFPFVSLASSSELRPAWSADGKHLAFVTSAGANSHISVVDVEEHPLLPRHLFAANLRTLTTASALNFDPSWSPDGKWIAFASTRLGQREIFRMSSAVGDADLHRLTFNSATDSNPSWSPEGRNIAFVSDRDGNREIYVMSAWLGETNQSTFHRITVDSGADEDPAWLPTYPTVVTVVTHGFGNGLFPNFQAPWDELKQKIESIPEPGSAYDNSVRCYKAEWASSAGWVEAATATLFEKFFEYHGDTALARAASIAAKLGMQEARFLAELAAIRIAVDLRVGDLLAAPNTSTGLDQRIHLVGHSRGAAVNARVALILSQWGYQVDQYTALDGYSTDWPNVSARLGDINITDEVNRANVVRRVNYRVEQGLAQYFGEVLGVPANDQRWGTFLDYLLQVLDWRAPERPNFENPVLLGYAIPGLAEWDSHHLNIVQLYSQSGDLNVPQPQRYIFDNYLGQHRSDPAPLASPLIAAASVPKFFNGTSSEDPPLPPPLNARGITDGTFSELAAMAREAESARARYLDDPFTTKWLTQISDPSMVLSNAWHVSGTARLVELAGNPRVELSTTNETSIGQVVAFGTKPNALKFMATTQGQTDDAALSVRFAGATLTNIALSSQGTIAQRVSIGGLDGRAGELSFALISNGGSDVKVELDDLNIFHEGQIQFQVGSLGLVLEWEGGVLQSASSITGEWSDVPVSSPYHVSFSEGATRFFRIRSN